MGSDPALDFDLSRADLLGNRLLDKLNALREAEPLYWSEPQQTWIVTSHEAVAEGFRGHLPLSSKRHEIIASFIPDAAEREKHIGYLMEVLPTWVNFSDPPQQLRLRRLMIKAFSRQVAESYRPYVRQVVAETLDTLAGRDQVEIIEEVARPVPARMILRLMGLGEEYYPNLKEWSLLANNGLSGYPTIETMAATNQCFLDMRALFLEEIARRQKAPTDDFLSSLLTAREGSDALSELEILGVCHLILLAGHDSTTNSIALGIAALAEDPEAASFMRAHPERIGDTIMELMRYSAMSTSMTRTVTEDFEWHGRQMKKGQVVHLMIAGANRDPRVFPNPERIDMTRPQDQNMTFAPGLHHCIGFFQARMQLSEFFPEFLRRYERFEMLDPEIEFSNGLSFRGPLRLNMRLTPRRPGLGEATA
jgi:pimeloyl-[acyl-carrier protein] synthase